MNLARYATKTGTTPAAFRKRLADHGVRVTHEAVRSWLNGKRKPSPTKAAAIEAATDGAVTVHDLRPDVFGKPKRAA